MSICIKCSMRRETLCLAVNLVDRYLASTTYDKCFDEEILLQNGKYVTYVTVLVTS